MKRYDYLLILAIGFTGLILVTSSEQVSALKIDGLWKLNANGEKADLNIKVTPEPLGSTSHSGQISGTAHWFGKGGPWPFTQNVIGFWDDKAGKIVLLFENKVVFDKSRDPEICNTVDARVSVLTPSIQKDLSNPSTIKKGLDELVPCHGRDSAFTGYLFGDNNANHEINATDPMMMAGVEQLFAGSYYPGGGIGDASAVRNTFGWCASFQVDVCGPPLATASSMNASSTTNSSNTAK